MRTNAVVLTLLFATASVAACSNKKADAMPAPAKTDSLAKDTATTKGKKVAIVPNARHVFDTVAAAGDRPLVRETYRYESASVRDPFKAYVEQAARGPELVDLRLVALLYDDHDPSGSIATFRDIGNDQRFTVVPGQRVGRLSVVNVTANTVKLRMDDFGTVREQTYSMRKPEDQKP